VIVWSRVTDEEFSGEVTAVTSEEVFILLVGEVPTRLHFEHIANGRLSLTKESR
jgi:ribosomal protein S1